jgi:hypothetical protein
MRERVLRLGWGSVRAGGGRVRYVE